MTSTISPARVPAPVQTVRAMLAAVAVSHVAVPAALLAGRSALRDQIAAVHPEFDEPEVERSAGIALVGGAAFCSVPLVLCLLPAWNWPPGRGPHRQATVFQPRPVDTSIGPRVLPALDSLTPFKLP